MKHNNHDIFDFPQHDPRNSAAGTRPAEAVRISDDSDSDADTDIDITVDNAPDDVYDINATTGPADDNASIDAIKVFDVDIAGDLEISPEVPLMEISRIDDLSVAIGDFDEDLYAETADSDPDATDDAFINDIGDDATDDIAVIDMSYE